MECRCRCVCVFEEVWFIIGLVLVVDGLGGGFMVFVVVGGFVCWLVCLCFDDDWVVWFVYGWGMGFGCF